MFALPRTRCTRIVHAREPIVCKIAVSDPPALSPSDQRTTYNTMPQITLQYPPRARQTKPLDCPGGVYLTRNRLCVPQVSANNKRLSIACVWDRCSSAHTQNNGLMIVNNKLLLVAGSPPRLYRRLALVRGGGSALVRGRLWTFPAEQVSQCARGTLQPV